jgi:hypothetical protein
MTRSFSKWRRFSLRTFLMLVTAFCLIFGWWASRSVSQRRAVLALQELGATVQYDDHWHFQRRYEYVRTVGRPFAQVTIEPLPKSWLRQRLGDDWFADVVEVGLRGGAVTNEVLKKAVPHLAKFEALERLDLSYAAVDGEGLCSLKPVKQLRHLRLGHTRILIVDPKLIELREELPHLQIAY